MEILLLGIKPVRYLRRHIGDSDDGRVDLMECWDEEWEDEAPVDAENAAKCNEFRRAKRARLAVAAQASKRALARQSTVSQGSSRDSNQSDVSKRGSSM